MVLLTMLKRGQDSSRWYSCVTKYGIIFPHLAERHEAADATSDDHCQFKTGDGRFPLMGGFVLSS